MDILFALVGGVILLLIFYIIPVGYNRRGKLLVVGSALLIALSTYYSNFVFQWWESLLILLLLSFLMTILISRYLYKNNQEKHLNERENDDEVKDIIQQPNGELYKKNIDTNISKEFTEELIDKKNEFKSSTSNDNSPLTHTSNEEQTYNTLANIEPIQFVDTTEDYQSYHQDSKIEDKELTNNIETSKEEEGLSPEEELITNRFNQLSKTNKSMEYDDFQSEGIQQEETYQENDNSDYFSDENYTKPHAEDYIEPIGRLSRLEYEEDIRE
ncbi:hypothetical protein [Pontibacillus yanchengensis]|uniref:Uncharacterized protein n=1 Tax=Pontibacillus yanchengensis Y32 TaxID=1385514 RepID=A0A0A2TDN0_9BACI|nr:hypothetical protein [Pontibacillus yanchengensis]KGP73922.1 hypothetical protein N782_21210 [Pontibacillus yanchengensis Y32]